MEDKIIYWLQKILENKYDKSICILKINEIYQDLDDFYDPLLDYFDYLASELDEFPNLENKKQYNEEYFLRRQNEKKQFLEEIDEELVKISKETIEKFSVR